MKASFPLRQFGRIVPKGASMRFLFPVLVMAIVAVFPPKAFSHNDEESMDEENTNRERETAPIPREVPGVQELKKLGIIANKLGYSGTEVTPDKLDDINKELDKFTGEKKEELENAVSKLEGDEYKAVKDIMEARKLDDGKLIEASKAALKEGSQEDNKLQKAILARELAKRAEKQFPKLGNEKAKAAYLAYHDPKFKDQFEKLKKGDQAARNKLAESGVRHEGVNAAMRGLGYQEALKQAVHHFETEGLKQETGYNEYFREDGEKRVGFSANGKDVFSAKPGYEAIEKEYNGLVHKVNRTQADQAKMTELVKELGSKEMLQAVSSKGDYYQFNRLNDVGQFAFTPVYEDLIEEKVKVPKSMQSIYGSEITGYKYSGMIWGDGKLEQKESYSFGKDHALTQKAEKGKEDPSPLGLVYQNGKWYMVPDRNGGIWEDPAFLLNSNLASYKADSLILPVDTSKEISNGFVLGEGENQYQVLKHGLEAYASKPGSQEIQVQLSTYVPPQPRSSASSPNVGRVFTPSICVP